MTDYSSLKVPDLKKLLGDRSLPISGNKADLIARLQEDDKKPGTAAAPAGGDDEIDWDEDEKATTAPAAAAVAAGGQGPVATPVAVPNQKVDVDPSKTTDLKTIPAADAANSKDTATAAAATAEPEAPKEDFSIGLQQTDAEKEAERRAARAKRFGTNQDDDEVRKAERAKKFGTDTGIVLKGLDDALPERRQKREREGGDKQGGRNTKRQTPDRRTEAAPAKASQPKPARGGKPSGSVTDDPAEKAKAEARAKRFAVTS